MKEALNSIKLKIWSLIYGPIYSWKYWSYRNDRKKFKILNSEDTINYIITKHCSVSRYGDGELAMVYHFMDGGNPDNFYINAFQNYSESLAKQLYQVLTTNKPNLLISIPYPIINTDEYIGLDKLFWKRFTILDIKRFGSLLSTNQIYGNSCFTRFYLNHRKKNFNDYVLLMKKIWDNLEICIVEGENSRLGVRNDLFNNARNVQRVLCPTVNAYDKYNQILSTISNLRKFDLYLIALGHTATILASDLSQLGLWAIDIGHIDIEYEWLLRNAKSKIVIPDKYVNETKEGRILTDCYDTKYTSEIIAKV